MWCIVHCSHFDNAFPQWIQEYFNLFFEISRGFLALNDNTISISENYCQKDVYPSVEIVPLTPLQIKYPNCNFVLRKSKAFSLDICDNNFKHALVLASVTEPTCMKYSILELTFSGFGTVWTIVILVAKALTKSSKVESWKGVYQEGGSKILHLPTCQIQ